MNTILSRVGLLAALLGSTASARAADLSGGNSTPSATDFSGIGVGADLGAAIGAAGSTTTSGAIGGAHAGYNLQSGLIVGGVEGDAMFASTQGGNFSQDFIASARVKGGYVIGSFLAYGTVGGAWSTTEYSSLGVTSSRFVPGVVFGVGGEFPVTRNISVRAEFLRYNFESALYSTPTGPLGLTASTNVLRLGASAHF